MKNILTPKLVEKYEKYLIQEERSPATRKQYRREILRFLEYGAGRTLTKELIIEYKKELMDKYQPVSVNTKLAAINGFLAFAGYGDLKVKQLKIQRRPYCSSDRELTKEEYTRLLYCAKNQGQEKIMADSSDYLRHGNPHFQAPLYYRKSCPGWRSLCESERKKQGDSDGKETAPNSEKIYGQSGN